MSKLKIVITLGVVVAAVVGWALFRPELLFINKTVNESLPGSNGANDQEMLASGTFHGIAHDTEGSATIYQFPNGKRVLRFTDFETSNGPDVQVFLAEAADANDNETVKAGYFSLGRIKGNKGDQNYELPDDLDLSKYHSVVIWCNRFSVNFGTAPLTDRLSVNL